MLGLLKENPEILYTLFENHASVMLMIDQQTSKIVACNKAAEQFYGYSVDEIKNLTIYDINILSPAQILGEMFKASKNKVNYFEFKHKRKSGEIIDVAVRSSPIEINKTKYLFSIINDITEKKQVEDNLKKSEERWQFALNGSDIGLWDWNIKTNEVYFSPKWKEMLGFTDKEIKNDLKEWENRIHPDDNEYVFEAVNKHFRGETKFYAYAHRVKCKDDTYKWILDQGKIIERPENGDPVRMIGTHTDIHQAKLNELKIKENEEKYKAIFENSPIGIELYNPEGKILDANEAALKIQKVKKINELKEINLFDKFPDINITDELKDGKRSWFQTAYKVNSRLIWLDVTITPLEINQNSGYLVQLIDITQQKLLEKDLKDSEFLFKTVANFANDWEYYITFEGLKFISPSCYDVTGYTPEEFFQDPELIQNIIADTNNAYLSHLAEVKNNTLNLHKEVITFDIVHKSGKIRHILHTCRPVIDDNGRYLGRRVSNKDITELKVAKQQIEKTQIDMISLLDQIDLTIILIDFDGKIKHLNKYAQKILGYDLNQLIETSVYSIMPTTKKDLKFNNLAFNNSEILEMVIFDKDGKEIPLTVNIVKGVWKETPSMFLISK